MEPAKIGAKLSGYDLFRAATGEENRTAWRKLPLEDREVRFTLF